VKPGPRRELSGDIATTERPGTTIDTARAIAAQIDCASTVQRE
jgi:hypothetical protein